MHQRKKENGKKQLVPECRRKQAKKQHVLESHGVLLFETSMLSNTFFKKQTPCKVPCFLLLRAF